ncbi:MAG: hypothetical protein WC860_06430 [Candidatus Margulisiibacteriota bacterium]|jgi:hypothetical protein
MKKIIFGLILFVLVLGIGFKNSFADNITVINTTSDYIILLTNPPTPEILKSLYSFINEFGQIDESGIRRISETETLSLWKPNDKPYFSYFVILNEKKSGKLTNPNTLEKYATGSKKVFIKHKNNELTIERAIK